MVKRKGRRAQGPINVFDVLISRRIMIRSIAYSSATLSGFRLLCRAALSHSFIPIVYRWFRKRLSWGRRPRPCSADGVRISFYVVLQFHDDTNSVAPVRATPTYWCATVTRRARQDTSPRRHSAGRSLRQAACSVREDHELSNLRYDLVPKWQS